MPRLILCADDFGFSPDVSRTIAGLAAQGRINAISCMAVMPGWEADSALLCRLPAHVEIGLHLVLTEETPISDMPRFAPEGRMPRITPLGRAARRKILPLSEIAAEIRAQFDHFEQALGRPPAFVDGHQHCHALPGIRSILLEETQRRAPGVWVRTCTDSVAGILARPYRGKAIGSAFHSRGLRREAELRGLSTNDSFAGHYGFAGNYSELFPRFLRRPGKRHLVMCHPGAGRREHDSIAVARTGEATALHALSIADMAAAQGLAFPA